MNGAQWLLAYIAPSVATMAVGGGLCLGGVHAARRAGGSRWRLARGAQALGLFVLLLGMAGVSKHVSPHWAIMMVLELLILAAAIWKGGWRERCIAAMNPCCLAVGSVFQALAWPTIEGYSAAASRALVLNGLQLGLMLLVAVRAHRYWVLWACSVQTVAVVTVVLALSAPGVSFWTWGTANNVWAYALDAVVLFGVVQGWRDAEAAGRPRARDPSARMPAALEILG